jgi:hypothetical protein
VGTLAAVAAALWIGIQDRKDAERRARQDRAIEREAFVRRRDYEECIRLLQLVEIDRRTWEGRSDDQERPRSVEATALVRALWGRRSWWGTVWDWYVGYRNPDNRFSSNKSLPDDVFPGMQREVAEMIAQLDGLER